VSFWAVTGVGCIVHATVGEDEGAGCPGVGGAHVQRVGGGGADVPGGVQLVLVQFVALVMLVDDLGAVGVVAAEALVQVAVEDDRLGRVLSH
jgi:hypothetical protein